MTALPAILLMAMAWYVLGANTAVGARAAADRKIVPDMFTGSTRPVPGRSEERHRPLEIDIVSDEGEQEGEKAKPVKKAPTLTEKDTGMKEKRGKKLTGVVDGEKEPAEEERDLIKEAGFDMIYPNFNKKTGRRDPFVPVSPMETDWDPIKKLAEERFRVIGTAMTPSGQIALLSIMEQTKVVREGDVMENGAVIKSISPYDVVLERENREMRLTMFTTRRVAKMDSGEDEMKLKELSNIQDIYKKYLDEKFGEETQQKEGETSRPYSFNEYLENSNSVGGETRDLMRE